MAERHNSLFEASWRLYRLRFSRYIDEKTSDINHQDVIAELSTRTELSGNYISSLILANLIALFGLLTNSVAVVIGAMLISPLMGPIFSLGLAFTMGDLVLSRRAVRNIAFSILLTVAVSAIFTLLSPLKEVTHEILARTRPNIYDLLIAVFSGTAGALALCTRKNYLFTTTGVAVATAVIPPLSVVGYGLGTWQFGIAVGGFLLFFTNLVAIVISSNAIFFFLRFRGSMAEDPRYTLRRRFQILGIVLVIISIPLVFTLVTDIRKLKLTKRVETILKEALNRQEHTRLTGISIRKEAGSIVVAASVNTVQLVGSAMQKTIEKELAAQIGNEARLELEQIIVRSGAVDPPKLLSTVIPDAIKAPETIGILREKIMARLNEGCHELDTYINPYKVNGCSIKFADNNNPISVTVTIARDFPSNLQEQRWFATILAKKLAAQVEVKIETVPLLPPISFTDEDEVDNESRKELEQLRQILAKLPGSRLSINVPAGSYRSNRQVKLRIVRLKEYLVKEIPLPKSHILMEPKSERLIRVKVLDQK